MLSLIAPLAAASPVLTVAPTLLPGASVRLDAPVTPGLSLLGDVAGYTAIVSGEPKGEGAAFYPLSRQKVGLDWYFWAADPKPSLRGWFLGPRVAMHQLFYEGQTVHYLFPSAVLGYRHIRRDGLVLHAAAGISAARMVAGTVLDSWEGPIYPALELRIGKELRRSTDEDRTPVGQGSGA